ncbi:hypothetical protein TNCV_2916351 [Trichonephila clavipes]|nr:hypothetical protein TNCV_2916351 [Trichonephila clavipes]
MQEKINDHSFWTVMATRKTFLSKVSWPLQLVNNTEDLAPRKCDSEHSRPLETVGLPFHPARNPTVTTTRVDKAVSGGKYILGYL